MALNPGLGILTAFPRELRDRIWEYLLRDSSLTFIQTSHQILTEASPIRHRIMYNNAVLKFRVSPTYHYKSWLSVEFNSASEKILQDLSHAKRIGFFDFHFEKMNKIVINIEAPDDWKDAGQQICLYKKCVALASLLENAKKGLPRIEIHLIEPSESKWSEGSSTISCFLRQHFAYEPTVEEYNLLGNHFMFDPPEIVLQAFYRLRNARSAEICAPSDRFHAGKYDNELSGLTHPVPFNPDLDADDLEEQQLADQLFVELDLALDLLPGNTANMLRLARFSSWYDDASGSDSSYEREMKRIIKMWPSRRVQERRIYSLYERYSGMLIFNRNLSTQHRTECSYTDALENAGNSGTTNSSWDQEAWHIGRLAWDEGIPPFNSEEYRRMYDLRSKWNNVQRCQDIFNEKVRSWISKAEDTDKKCGHC